MADFTPARSAQELHFANAERREIVVQQEALELILLEEQVQPLHVFLGAQRKGRKRLRLAASKQRRTVYARQQADLAGDLANLVERAAIRTPPRVQNFVAENILAQLLKRPLGQRPLLFIFLGNGIHDLGFQLIHQLIAFLLRMLFGVQRILQLRAVLLLDFVVQRLVKRKWRDHNLLRLQLRVQFANRRHDLLDLRVAKFQRIHDRFFRNLQRARLHHHDALFGARDHDVEQAGLLFRQPSGSPPVARSAIPRAPPRSASQTAGPSSTPQPTPK